MKNTIQTVAKQLLDNATNGDLIKKLSRIQYEGITEEDAERLKQSFIKFYQSMDNKEHLALLDELDRKYPKGNREIFETHFKLDLNKDQ